jgi:hypothetical protein
VESVGSITPNSGVYVIRNLNIMSNGILDVNLAIEAFRRYLTQSMELWGAKYELQYSDYSENQWTAPVSLTDERIERIVTDYSIKNVRLSFTV